MGRGEACGEVSGLKFPACKTKTLNKHSLGQGQKSYRNLLEKVTVSEVKMKLLLKVSSTCHIQQD